MGGQLVPASKDVAQSTSAAAFGVVTAALVATAERLRVLADRVRQTYGYVDSCARAVDWAADEMASLSVDEDTVGAHRDAAALMRMALERAAVMATRAEALGGLFDETSAAHRRDYGSVAAAAQALPGPQANGKFYSNR